MVDVSHIACAYIGDSKIIGGRWRPAQVGMRDAWRTPRSVASDLWEGGRFNYGACSLAVGGVVDGDPWKYANPNVLSCRSNDASVNDIPVNKLCGRPPQYAPASCKLTYDLLTLKVVS